MSCMCEEANIKGGGIMKKILLFLSIIFLLTSELYACHVKGYTRKDGTYVQGHCRSHNNVRDNYFYKGNSDPYTGTNKDNPIREYYRTSFFDYDSSYGDEY